MVLSPSSDELAGQLLALSAGLNRAETVESAVSHAVELAETAFERPVVAVHEYDPPTRRATPVESSAADPTPVDAGRLPESVGDRAAHSADDGTPEAIVDTDPGEQLQAEVLVPVGRRHVLSVGTTDEDGFEDADVETVEGIAATLETALARIGRAGSASVDCDLARALFEQSDEATFVSDPYGAVVAVNDAAVELTGRGRDALRGSGLSEMYRGEAERTVRAHLERAADASEPCTTTVEAAADPDHRVELTSRTVDVDGVTYVRTTARDLPVLSGGRSEPKGAEDDATVLRRLSELTANADGFDDTVERLLSLGTEYFGLDTGILSTVDGDDYEVEALADATGAYETGAVYDLEETMCEATLAAEGTDPLAFADVADSDHGSHPAAENVRSYIGAPVVAGGETYGTVNFSMTRPRSEPFRPEERTFVGLIAQWVGAEIERRRRFEDLQRYETILEAVGDPVYALDADGRFTYVNEAARREFGYGTEVIGEDPSVGMADADVERVREQIAGLLATGERSTTAEFELETADGGRKIVENRLALIGDDEFRGTAGVLRDITDLKERQRQLESFQRAVEDAADGIAILDGDEYTYVDQTHVDMYGFESKAQLLGNSWRELYDEAEIERLEADAFPALESDGHWRGMVTGTRPDGSTFPAELSLTIIEDGRLVCTVRDETERKERERELQLKDRAMDEATVGIQITDPNAADNPLVYVNDGFERMTGYPREEALGRNPRFLQSEDADPEKVTRLREAVRTEQPESLELRNERKDGTPYWTRLSITPVTDETGDVQHFIGIQQDVTERREREKQAEARTAILRRIYEVTIDPEMSFEEKIRGLLAAGREHLNLPYGFLARIDPGDESTPGTQTIIEGSGSHELLQSGESAPLSQSYCRRTIQQDDPMSITDAEEAGWTDDPAYETFGLETYIGDELLVSGDHHWTLCFASEEPRDTGFDDFEESVVSLVGQWAGYEIERRRATEELRQEREKLELTLSGTNTGLGEWDLETGAVTWNETLTDIVGRDVDSVQEFEQAVHAEDRDRVRESLNATLETGETWVEEFRMAEDDGTVRWIGARGTPTYDDDGEPVRMLATATDITDRKRRERERRRNERRFQSLFEDPEMLVGLLDTDGTLLEANGTGLSYIDDTLDDVRGEPFWETPWWAHSEDQRADLQEWIRRAADGEYVEYDATHVGPDGDLRYVSGTIRPVTDAAGSVESLAISARDVTERERQERELRDRQRKLDLVLSNTDTAVAELDLESGAVRWDEGIGENDIGSPETLGAFLDAVHPEDRERLQADLNEMIRTGDPSRGEYRIFDEDGERIWIDAQAVVAGDGDDSTEVVTIATDVTDRKERERELELKERAMNEANVGITISDPDTEDNPLVYVNDGFVDQTGYDRGEAVGRNCRFLQADDRDQSALDDLRTAIEAEEPTTVELRNYRKDGEQFWNRLSVTPVYGEDDGLVNYIGIQQDVTDKKRRERRLEALHGTTRNLLQTDSIDEATAAAVETLADQFEFEMASVYLRDEDELVRTASTERLPTDTTERFHRGESPLWEAVDAGETVHYEDYTDVDDGVDRGDVAASTYLPVGDHGALVVGVTDSERLGESERRLLEVLCGNLAAVLDSLEREASLRASERRYRSLAENIPNGAVLTFDEHLTYGLAAGELLSAFGLAESDISGKEVGTVLGDGDHELVSRFRAALDGERTDSRIDLQDRTIRIHIVPVDPGEDADMYGLALAQDVTDEARRERELFEERERFRLLTESVDEYAFITVGEDGTIETWPAGAENLFGYDAETAVGMSMAELHPEADRETDVPGRLLRQARIAGESADEGWRVREDGSEFYADVRYAPLETDDGEFQGYAKVIRDMTDRRRERRRTERFVEESDDVVTIVDTDGEITYASGSATRVLGYDPDDLVGENLFDYLHPDGRNTRWRRSTSVSARG